MNKKDFSSIIEYLDNAYGSPANNARAIIYYEALLEYDSDDVFQSIRRWIKTSEFYPKVAEIIRGLDGEQQIADIIEDLNQIAQLKPDESFDKKNYSKVTAQIIDELGGRSGIIALNQKELQRQVRYIYKYAAEGIKDNKPKIESRSGGTVKLDQALNNGGKNEK